MVKVSCKSYPWEGDWLRSPVNLDMFIQYAENIYHLTIILPITIGGMGGQVVKVVRLLITSLTPLRWVLVLMPTSNVK